MEHTELKSKKKVYLVLLVIMGCLVIIGLFILLSIFRVTSPKPTQQNNAQQTTNATQDSGVNQRVMYDPQTGIRYEIKKTWSTENGGYGKSIVIPEEYLNETDMVALGNRLRIDNKDQEKVYIFLYTDAAAVELKDKPASQLSDSESDFYFDHYVGTYTKTTTIGFEEFTLYFDGFLNDNIKTIQY